MRMYQTSAELFKYVVVQVVLLYKNVTCKKQSGTCLPSG